jgi:hypothetical protein
MALRDQPYLPLYVQDYLTDEKLSMCSWATQGVYIKLLCLLHKSEPYGTILLKQSDKQTKNFASDFALKITRLLPIDRDTLRAAIEELINEGCLTIDGDRLFQKRMVRDNAISELRSDAGSKGGKKTQQFAKAKCKANTEYENEYENDNKDKGGTGEKGRREFPEEVKELYRSTVILFDEKTRPKTQSQIDSWHDTLDKCMRLDGYSADQIRDIVKRMRMDDFWRTNFMSIIKLRNLNKEKIKYIDVFAAKVNSKHHSVSKIQSVADVAREVIEELTGDHE